MSDPSDGMWHYQDEDAYRVSTIHRLRVQAYKRLDDWKRSNIPGGYAGYSLRRAEHVVTIDMTLREAEDLLRRAGFSYEPVAAAKTSWLIDGDRLVEAGSWVRRDGRWDDYQLHVHLFITEDTEIVFAAHNELSWIRHPIRHYKPSGIEFGNVQIVPPGHYDPEEGVEMFWDLLLKHGEEKS